MDCESNEFPNASQYVNKIEFVLQNARNKTSQLMFIWKTF